MSTTTKADPTPSELIQEEVNKIKRLLGLDVNRLAIGSDIEGIAGGGTGLFGSADYTITGVNVIEFVNVSTSLGPSQGGSGFPAQVVGLTVTPHAGSDTQLDLAWTAITAPDFNYYNVYRGITSGFVVDSSSEIAQPVTNSYQNTGLSVGTTYYYRVSVTNDAELEGAPSSQVSGTTTGTAPAIPMLELHFDGNFIDTSPNAFPSYWISVAGTNGFTTGQFGSSVQFNTPVTPGGVVKDGIWFDHAGAPELLMNTSIGFSFSGWVYPVDLTAAAGWRRFILENTDDANNNWSLSIDPAGILYFLVTKAGTTYKRQVSGFVINSWQHIGAVFNGATNTVEVYRNGVAGVSSTIADVGTVVTQGRINIGGRVNDDANTYYEGRLDELRYYQKVLTSTQINNLKNTNAT